MDFWMHPHVLSRQHHVLTTRHSSILPLTRTSYILIMYIQPRTETHFTDHLLAAIGLWTSPDGVPRRGHYISGTAGGDRVVDVRLAPAVLSLSPSPAGLRPLDASPSSSSLSTPTAAPFSSAIVVHLHPTHSRQYPLLDLRPRLASGAVASTSLPADSKKAPFTNTSDDLYDSRWQT
ncbi:hypothetical protein FA95DRAFT_473195 [Auriscalpium vulgare]|uniref:Uncharacterized protein n=1 Tax=Auriscalpium vulgare TaxID=40419 RepID=A0ACB8SBR2_9AGAM|nr:hypothetical protein FA95DRAFT_473195 [Auriscalpium vulgare]